MLSKGLGEGRQKPLDQARKALRHRPIGRGAAEAQEMTDAAVEAVDFLDDGVQMLA